DGRALWVCDEDRVGQAREELAQFLKDPRAPRYASAGSSADAIRQEEDAEEREYARRQSELRELMRTPERPQGGRLVVSALMAVSVVVRVATRGGGEPNQHAQQPIMQALVIAP